MSLIEGWAGGVVGDMPIFATVTTDSLRKIHQALYKLVEFFLGCGFCVEAHYEAIAEGCVLPTAMFAAIGNLLLQNRACELHAANGDWKLLPQRDKAFFLQLMTYAPHVMRRGLQLHKPHTSCFFVDHWVR